MPDTSVSTTPILNAADVREQERRHDFANLNSPGILYVIGWPGASRTCSIRQTGAYLGDAIDPQVPREASTRVGGAG